MAEKIKNEIHDRGNIFWSLAVGLVVVLGLYLYFLSNTIYTAVVRQQTEKAIAVLEESIGGLESSYLNLKNTVTIEVARDKGFTDIFATQYISRKSLGRSLSLNTKFGI
ncbi:MAG: hypothetical protein UX39_C0011G0016 [Candidatus Magasanikbacteria bacterium GW2011_GWA2_46_17]|uniref:Cell division protein FtsL n=1 Tax=Candidatus Magasanikbacteria bacterium GW2011_GWA2_46_17 TaxID=1619042 RepID=A0A0G1P0S5_9BACT|nr:MAG: hypothetical protein UX39_C0011G0016 [Candidatus Magasanikbacteria bacterium GW2011_GWA2_46_17]